MNKNLTKNDVFAHVGSHKMCWILRVLPDIPVPKIPSWVPGSGHGVQATAKGRVR